MFASFGLLTEMAIQAPHCSVSSTSSNTGKFCRYSSAVEVSTTIWRAENFVRDNLTGRNEVRERATGGAELDCRSVSRPKLFCSSKNHGNCTRNLWWGRIRAKDLDRNFSFRFYSGKSTRRLSGRDEFANPVWRRIATAGRRRREVLVRAAVDDPYEILGVSRSATEKEIKQAYRKLALKFHPDVNKEAGAQKKFLQIKAAYQTVVDAKSRAKYDSSTRANSQWDPFSWETERPFSQKSKEDEDFYGLEDFFRDLQDDTRKKEKQEAKPKSLWEELAEIGEEFVEFLEKELNITDSNNGDKSSKYRPEESWDNMKQPSDGSNMPEDEKEKRKVESEIAEIEEMLAKIKKELGI